MEDASPAVLPVRSFNTRRLMQFPKAVCSVEGPRGLESNVHHTQDEQIIMKVIPRSQKLRCARELAVAKANMEMMDPFAPLMVGYDLQHPLGCVFWFKAFGISLPQHYRLQKSQGKAPRLSSKATEMLRDTIQVVHSLGISHGDLHEGNVVVKGDEVRLIDWEHASFPEEGPLDLEFQRDFNLFTAHSSRLMLAPWTKTKEGGIELGLLKRQQLKMLERQQHLHLSTQTFMSKWKRITQQKGEKGIVGDGCSGLSFFFGFESVALVCESEYVVDQMELMDTVGRGKDAPREGGPDKSRFFWASVRVAAGGRVYHNDISFRDKQGHGMNRKALKRVALKWMHLVDDPKLSFCVVNWRELSREEYTEFET